MVTKCPTFSELLEAAVGRQSGPMDAAMSQHIATCPACQHCVRETQALSALLHVAPVAPPTSACLTDDAVAEIAEGGNGPVDHVALEHVAACGDCRARVVATIRLLNDPEVSAAARALPTVQPRWSSRRLAIAGGLAAAAAAAFVLAGPVKWLGESSIAGNDARAHRDPTITATTAPRIVSPASVIVGESIRWTSVPSSDLYRVRIWNAQGTVVWTIDTRDTSVVLPQVISARTRYLWEVKARTGWDRWVASDFHELTLRAGQNR